MNTTETARPAGHLAAPSSDSAPSSTTISQDDCPTEIIPAASPASPASPVPVRRSILHSAASASAPVTGAQPERSPFADWRGRSQTEELPAVSSDAGRPAIGTRRSRRPRVSTHHKPTRGREAAQAPSRSSLARTKVLRHLRAALAGLLIAAALLTGLQLYAAAGISSARQAALAQQAARTGQATEQSAPTPAAPAEQADAPAEQWAVEGTAAAAPSPLDLPRCTTSPDTPLPCLATISPSQTRAVILEEDTSLTALVRR